MSGTQTKRRISVFTAGFMIALAALIDGVQAVVHLIDIGVITVVVSVIADWLIGIFAWLTFYFWFKSHEVSFVGPKQILTLLGSAVSDLATGGIFPSWIVGTIVLVMITRAEDIMESVTGKKVDITGKLALASGKPVGPKGRTLMPPGAKPPQAPPGAVPPRIG